MSLKIHFINKLSSINLSFKNFVVFSFLLSYFLFLTFTSVRIGNLYWKTYHVPYYVFNGGFCITVLFKRLAYFRSESSVVAPAVILSSKFLILVTYFSNALYLFYFTIKLNVVSYSICNFCFTRVVSFILGPFL